VFASPLPATPSASRPADERPELDGGAASGELSSAAESLVLEVLATSRQKWACSCCSCLLLRADDSPSSEPACELTGELAADEPSDEEKDESRRKGGPGELAAGELAAGELGARELHGLLLLFELRQARGQSAASRPLSWRASSARNKGRPGAASGPLARRAFALAGRPGRLASSLAPPRAWSWPELQSCSEAHSCGRLSGARRASSRRKQPASPSARRHTSTSSSAAP